MSEKYKDKEFLESLYLDKGLSTREIAEEFEVTHAAIRYWLDKYDIETRPEGRHRTVESKVAFGPNGYEKTQVRVGDKPKTILIHRLIAVAKYGIEDVKGMVVHHKNEMKCDNRPENIELMRHGEHSMHHNNDIRNKELSESEVREIRRMAENTPASQSEIAGRFNVDQSLISRIVNKERYSEVV